MSWCAKRGSKTKKKPGFGTYNVGKGKLKAPSSAFLISRSGQAAQKQQRPRCPNRKMYLEIRRADEWLFRGKIRKKLR